MKKIELFNLYVGDRRLPPCNIGPIRIEFKPDYEELIDDIYKPQQIITDWSGNRRIQNECKGKWIPTADLYIGNDDELSILCEDSRKDGGVWDICQILTFITARYVCTEDQIDSKSYKLISGKALCQPSETILTAQFAWNSRGSIKSKKLEYALLLYNEALS